MLVFGDSIAKGVGTEGSSWAELLADSGVEVSNFAEDGERAESTLERIRGVKLSDVGEIAIIATGTNNCGRIEKDGEALEPDIKSFEEDFRELLKLAGAKFSRAIVLGLMPTDGTVMPLGGNAIVTYDNKTISEFNDLLAKLCEKSGTLFVDLLPYFLDKEGLLSDHIHPNKKGHAIIYRQLLEVL